MYSAGLTMGDIDAWYCSHPHADHIGGVEGIALSTFFNPFWRVEKKEWLDEVGTLNVGSAVLKAALPDNCKPQMYGHKEVLQELWKASAPGLKTLQGVMNVKLSTYFNVQAMTTNVERKIEDGDRTWTFYTIESTHVISGNEHMPSFGLMFKSSDGKCVYFPTDTMLMMPPSMRTFYDMADIVYQDCETGPKSGVHSHIDEIEKVDPEIKKKLYLYHYNNEPEVDESQYAGILRTGDIQEY